VRMTLLPGRFAVARLDANAPLPVWAARGPLVFVARTPEELSIVVDQAAVPADVRKEAGFAALAVQGPLDFELVGILARIATALAHAKVSILAQSTFDTDYVLVRESDLRAAIGALQADGIEVVDP
jgi:uncharacterized protein